MTAISVSERLLEMAAFYTPLALTVTPLFTKTAAVHSKQLRSLSVKGTGAVFLRHFMERTRNAAICALVQVAVGSK